MRKGREQVHQVTVERREYVRTMVACGVSREQIAKVIGVHPDTIMRNYKAELETADTEANAKVAMALYNKAINGNVTAQIFWLKSRANWREADADVGTKGDFVGLLRRALNVKPEEPKLVSSQ